MRLIFASLALASLPLTLAAPAQAQSVGMQVVDTSGGNVGLVSKIDANLVTVRTDRHEVALPKASFTPHEGKLLFGMTQAELNAATDKSLAEAAAALQPGATVKGSAGASVGTIDSIDADFVTIKLESEKLVRIPRAGIAAGAEGAVIGMTAQELAAHVPEDNGTAQ